MIICTISHKKQWLRQILTKFAWMYHWDNTELIRIWGPWPDFQGHSSGGGGWDMFSSENTDLHFLEHSEKLVWHMIYQHFQIWTCTYSVQNKTTMYEQLLMQLQIPVKCRILLDNVKSLVYHQEIKEVQILWFISISKVATGFDWKFNSRAVCLC